MPFIGMTNGLLQLQMTEKNSSQLKVKKNILILRNEKSGGVCMTGPRSSNETIWTQCLFFPSLGFHSHMGEFLRVARWLQIHQLYIFTLPSPDEKRAFLPQ